MGNAVAVNRHPDTTPIGDSAPTFDPNYGFVQPRKPREMLVTEEELIAARIEHQYRDYCAHKFLEYDQCRVNHFPLVVRCGREVHNWQTCQFEDYVMRMKEYEREKRLLERRKRRQEKQAAAA